MKWLLISAVLQAAHWGMPMVGPDVWYIDVVREFDTQKECRSHIGGADPGRIIFCAEGIAPSANSKAVIESK